MNSYVRFYVACLNPSIIDTIFGTLSPGRAKRRARASPRIDLILPPEKVDKREEAAAKQNNKKQKASL